MSNQQNVVKVSSAQSEIKATVSNALANALICGIDECAENRRELTQLQKIDLAKYAIMNYDEAIKTCDHLEYFAQVEARFPLLEEQ